MKRRARSRNGSIVLMFLLSAALGWAGDDPEDQPPSTPLPPELQGAKIYRLPEKGKPGGPSENPIIYKSLAYEDLNLERLVLNLSLSLKAVDRPATIRRIYFQDIRANGIPVHVETFDQEFKLSNKAPVDLPAPLQCTIAFSDLDSLDPIKTMVNQDQVQISGRSFLEIKLNTLQKVVVRAQRLVLPVEVKEEVPLRMFSASPVLQMAANRILDTLTDPSSQAAMALAKEHLAKITGERALEQKGRASLYFLYCEYVLKDPKSGVAEKSSQSGTGFVVAADGKLLTAKRVVEPWKFDPPTIFWIARDHLEVDTKSIRLAAWPAGATILAGDGTPDLQTAFSTEKRTLQVLRTAPDRFEKRDYEDPDSGARATLDVHAGGESDVAVLQLGGETFQPLELAATGPGVEAISQLRLLGFPFGLSQTQAHPRPIGVKATSQGGTVTLDHALNPGQSGGPLVTEQGTVLAMCAEPNQCVPVESLRKFIP